jgi:hypothetical protein
MIIALPRVVNSSKGFSLACFRELYVILFFMSMFRIEFYITYCMFWYVIETHKIRFDIFLLWSLVLMSYVMTVPPTFRKLHIYSQFLGRILKFSVVLRSFDSFGVLQSPSESFRVLRSLSESFGVLRSPSEFFGVLRSPSESFGVLRSPSESFGVLRSPSESFGMSEFCERLRILFTGKYR